MRVPGSRKLHGGTAKWILRRAFGPLLPDEVVRRRKEGFSMPMKQWLAGPLQPMMRELLSRDHLRARGLFEPREVDRLVDDHVSGRRNNAHRLWCLMALELSLRSLQSAGSRNR